MKKECFHWGLLSKYRNVIYGVSAVSILIYHYTSIYSYYPGYMRSCIAQYYFNFIGSVGVEIFLFLSGISMYFSYISRDSIGSFIKKRIFRILITYIPIGFCFWFITDFILTDNGSSAFINDFTLLSFWQTGEYRFWYVALLLILYCIFPIIYHTVFFQKKEKRNIFFIMSSLILLLIMIFIVATPMYNRIGIALTRIPIFVYGTYCGKKVFEKQTFRTFDYMLILIGFGIKLCSIYLPFNSLGMRATTSFFSFSCCPVLCMIIQISRKPFNLIWHLFNKCGYISFELYLTNVAVIKFAIDIGIFVISKGNYIVILIIGFITSIISYYFSKCIIKLKQTIQEKHNYTLHLILLVLLVFFIKLFCNIPIKTITVPSDEFNTVAAAAKIIGLPWDNVITPSGYYGYTAIIMFLPILLLSKTLGTGQLLCQALLGMNVLCETAASAMIFLILKRISHKKLEPQICFYITLMTAFIPQFFMTGQMTQNEASYCLFHTITVYSLICYNQTNVFWKRCIFSIICALGCILALAGNNRGIVLGIALIATVVLVKLLRKQWLLNPVVFFSSFIAFYCIHGFLLEDWFKKFFAQNAYNTDAGLILERIPRILSNFSDLKACIITAIGWIYTFIVSTYGIGIILLVCFGYILINVFKQTMKTDLLDESLVILFSLWLLGTTVLCIINFLDSIQGIFQFRTDILYNPERVDKIFYFRYYIGLVPILIAFTIYLLVKYQIYCKKYFIHAIISIYSFVLLFFHGYIAVVIDGMSYATTSSNFLGFIIGNWTENYRYGNLFSPRFIIATIISILGIGVFIYCLKTKKKIFFYQITSLFGICFCIFFSYIYSGPRSDYARNSIENTVLECVKEYDVDSIFVEDNSVAFLYQFQLPYNEVNSVFEKQKILVTSPRYEIDFEVVGEYTVFDISENCFVWVRNDENEVIEFFQIRKRAY